MDLWTVIKVTAKNGGSLQTYSLRTICLVVLLFLGFIAKGEAQNNHTISTQNVDSSLTASISSEITVINASITESTKTIFSTEASTMSRFFASAKTTATTANNTKSNSQTETTSKASTASILISVSTTATLSNTTSAVSPSPTATSAAATSVSGNVTATASAKPSKTITTAVSIPVSVSTAATLPSPTSAVSPSPTATSAAATSVSGNVTATASAKPSQTIAPTVSIPVSVSTAATTPNATNTVSLSPTVTSAGATSVSASSRFSSITIPSSSSITVPTTKPATTGTIPPDNKLEVNCLIKFNVTFLESYAEKGSTAFKQLDERIVPLLAQVYEVSLGKVGYRGVTTTGFSSAGRLGTQISYSVSFQLDFTKTEEIKNSLLMVSTDKVEGKVFKTSSGGVLFVKNSFEFSEERKVEPKKEEKVVVDAEFKITSQQYTEELNNDKSKEYVELKRGVEEMLNRTFQDLPGFVKGIVKSFTKGSIVVNFELIFDSQKSGTKTEAIKENVEQTYKKATTDNTLGRYTVGEIKVIKVESQASTQPPASSTLATWMIVLIASCAVVVLLLLVLAAQCRKARRYKDIVGELHSNALYSNGYGKSLYEMDDLRDATTEGTPGLMRLKKTSMYLNSFEGIPRAKLTESSINEGIELMPETNEGVVNESYMISVNEKAPKEDESDTSIDPDQKDIDIESRK